MFVEPYQANQALAGFDLASDPRLRKAIEAARDGGKRLMVARLDLTHKSPGHPAVLILQPVYSEGPPMHGITQRKERFRGAVLGIFRMSQVVSEALARLPPESVAMRRFDLRRAAGRAAFLPLPARVQRAWPAIARDSPGGHDGLRQVIDIDAAGGRWRLAFGEGPAFVAQRRTWQSWLIPAMGLLLTIVVNAIIFATLNRARRDERMLREHAAELERSREQYRSLVENIDQGITLIDRNFNIVTINASQARMFGRPREQFIGKKCYREFEKRDVPCGHCPGARAMVTGRPCVAETTGVREDGGTLPVLLHAFPLPEQNGRVMGFIELVEDISQRRKAEKALRDSEALLRNIFSAIPDLLTVHDRDRRVVLSNWHGFESVPLSVRGAVPHCYACYQHRDKPCPDCRLTQVFETGIATTSICFDESTQRTKEVNSYPVFDDEGRVVLVTEYVRDITDRHRAERELKDYALALETANKNLTQLSAPPRPPPARRASSWPTSVTRSARP